MSRECEGIRELLSSWHDGELAAEEEARVREHLAECATCRETSASYAALDEALGEEAVRSEEEWERLALRVDAAVAAEPLPGDAVTFPGAARARRERRSRWSRWMYAPAAGAVAAALLIALFHPLLRELGSGPVGPEPLPPRVPPRATDEGLRGLGYVDEGAVESRDRDPETAGAEKPAGAPGETAGAERPSGAPGAAAGAERPAGTPGEAETEGPSELPTPAKPPGTRDEVMLPIPPVEEKAELRTATEAVSRVLRVEAEPPAEGEAKKALAPEPWSEPRAPASEPSRLRAQEIREVRLDSGKGAALADGRVRGAVPRERLVSLGAEAMAGEDVDTIHAVAALADRFVAEHPEEPPTGEIQVLRVTLWARLAELDPERFCAIARDRADEWTAVPGTESASPEAHEAVRVLRERTCPE